MKPSITAVRMTGARHRAELPLLVLGPSLGTSAATLWAPCAAAGLADAFDVVAWDLPGHGHNRAVPDEPFSIAELAAGVLHVVDDILAERGGDDTFFYAGDSVGGAVGLQLLLDAPTRVAAAVLLCTGAKIGSHESWTGRMAQVSMSGTPVMVSGSAERWFGAGFLEREPDRGWRWPASRTLRPRPRASARSPTASRTDGSSCWTGSPTWRRRRCPRSWRA